MYSPGEAAEHGVYELVTKLCEKTLALGKVHCTNRTVRKLRKRAYEVLLSKRVVESDTLVCLEGNSDVYCQLLAWKFLLVHKYGLRSLAEDIDNCVEYLNNSNILNEDTFLRLIELFLQLKRAPGDESRIMDSQFNSTGRFFKCYNSDRFKLPDPFICTNAKYSDSSFRLQKTVENKWRRTLSTAATIEVSAAPSCRWSNERHSAESDSKDDDGYDSPTKDLPMNIWEIVHKSQFTNLRTWETLGDPTPDKEPPFITESKSNVTLLIHEMDTYQWKALCPLEVPSKCTRIVDMGRFVSDVKNLLVGIVAHSFQFDDQGNIVLVPGTSVEGISHTALRAYCVRMIFCGTCYRALSDMITVDPYTRQHKQNGYIFAELCESVRRYLHFYRVAALSLPASQGLLHLHDHIRKLSKHLHMLCSVCKVGPFAEPGGRLPHGVALLNYLYERAIGVSDRDVVMVLCSALYPCLQVYFNQFLRRWILEGNIVDSYGEFFIMPTHKYVTTRGRTYWTRSYTVREDIVPTFLTGMHADVLNCGKAMNLLKLCVPNSAMCKYLMGKKPNLLQCCFARDQLDRLEGNVRCYYLEVLAELGPKFSLGDVLTRSQEREAMFLNAVSKKRAATLKRIELEKLRKAEEVARKKSEEMKLLKEQFERAVAEKEASRALELQRELEANDKIVKMKMLEEKIIKEEAESLITYYDKLFEESDRRAQSISRHIENVKRSHLNEDLVEESSSSETFHSLLEDQSSVDVVNANVSSATEEARRNKAKILSSEFGFQKDTKVELSVTPAPITEAQRNRMRVLSEMGVIEEDVVVPVEENRPLSEAQRNKLRVLSTELGIDVETTKISEVSSNKDEMVRPATEAERNKLRVLGTEFGIDVNIHQVLANEDKIVRPATEAERNKLRVLGTELGIGVESAKIHNKGEMVRPATEAERNKLRVLSTELGIDVETPKIHEVSSNEGDKVRPITEAQRNKLRVLSTELGIDFESLKEVSNEEGESRPPKEVRPLTDAQRNKLRVLSTELGIAFEPLKILEKTVVSDAQRNKLRVMSSEMDNKPVLRDDNLNVTLENLVNKTTTADDANQNYIIQPLPVKKSAHLKLDFNVTKKVTTPMTSSGSLFESFMKSPNFEFQRPMSVDSTPVIEFSPLPKLPDRMTLETLSTAASNFTDEGFHFPFIKESPPMLDTDVSKRLTRDEARNLSVNSLSYFVHKSVFVPVTVQTELIQGELLKYFVNDLKYLDHLVSLRNYFFLLDDHFGRNITEELFERLYDASSPKDLVNCRTLNNIVFNALDVSSSDENSKCLSFKINALPKHFDLGDICVLDCLCLSYSVGWPLNILLPSDTIRKYDEVFRFLLKLHRVSWILKKIFMELKLLVKQADTREGYLILSPQYQKLQQYRHVMTHFVQTLQSYVFGEVLQSSWICFKENLASAVNLDQLYALHTTYIKNILFMCLLNQRSAPIRKVLNNIFIVILKFYDYLRSRPWRFDEDVFLHPNFAKLESIFGNFVDFVRFLCNAGRKVVRTGYQPQLEQFVDMLTINKFYLRKTSTSA